MLEVLPTFEIKKTMCVIYDQSTTGPGWSSGAEKENLDDLPKEKGEEGTKPLKFPRQGNNLWTGAFTSTSSARRPCTLILLLKGHLVRMSKSVQSVLARATAARLEHDFQMCLSPRQSGCCLKPRELYKLQSLIGLFSPNLWPRGSRAGEPDRQPGEELHPPGPGGEREEQNPENKEFIRQDWPPCLPPVSHTSCPFYRGGRSWYFIRVMFSYYNNN